MVRKMSVVSLWCIQTDPSHRPAMNKVVEMLERSIKMLEIPPKPFLSSPSTSPIHLSSEILWFVWLLRCNAEYVTLENNVMIITYKNKMLYISENCNGVSFLLVYVLWVGCYYISLLLHLSLEFHFSADYYKISFCNKPNLFWFASQKWNRYTLLISALFVYRNIN